MARLGAADRHADAAHSVYRTGYARFIENDVFDRFSLFLFNVFSRDNRRLLRLVLSFFFRPVGLDDDVLYSDIAAPSPGGFCGESRQGQPRRNSAGQQGVAFFVSHLRSPLPVTIRYLICNK